MLIFPKTNYNSSCMGKTTTGLIRLTRHQDYTVMVTITTLLGFLVSGIHLNINLIPRMLIVLLANQLSVAFAFMINDVVDAHDDATDKLKALRNPVSAGLITANFAYFASFSTALISVFIFYSLGPIPFLLGIFDLILSAFYSLKFIRLKSIPVLDLVSHGLMLGGLQMLCAYFTLMPYLGFDLNWFLPFLFIVAISFRGQLFNQVKDFTCDQTAGINNTTEIVGVSTAHLLMSALLVMSGLIFIYCLIVNIIPLWVFLLMLLMGIVFLKDPLTKLRGRKGLEKTEHFHIPMLIIGSISLILWTISRFF
jgi:4-hydroxybenzoate polyprenyltransferase